MKKKIAKVLKTALVRLKDKKVLLATLSNIGMILLMLGVVDASALKNFENVAVVIVGLLVNIGVLHKPKFDIEEDELSEG